MSVEHNYHRLSVSVIIVRVLNLTAIFCSQANLEAI
jgi:hypothetical protein